MRITLIPSRNIFHGDAASEGHGAGYGIIHLNASVYIRVHQNHVWECFVTLPLTNQVYLAADRCAAGEELPVQTIFLQHGPLICLHVKTQSLAPKQVEGTVEFCGNQVISEKPNQISLKYQFVNVGNQR